MSHPFILEPEFCGILRVIHRASVLYAVLPTFMCSVMKSVFTVC